MNENWLANNLYWIVPTITIIIIAICGFIYKRIREKKTKIYFICSESDREVGRKKIRGSFIGRKEFINDYGNILDDKYVIYSYPPSPGSEFSDFGKIKGNTKIMTMRAVKIKKK